MPQERVKVIRGLGDTFKTHATGVLIILAAAWRIDLKDFRSHLSSLANEGFAKVGANAPDVRRDLPEDRQFYAFEAATITLLPLGKR